LRVWIDWGEEKMKGGLRKLERGQSVGKLERGLGYEIYFQSCILYIDILMIY
jgi:hypothetical protein